MDSVIRNPFGGPSPMRKAYGEALVELGAQREDVVVLSADVQSSDFSSMFETAYPKRFFNVGIAEPALVDAAVGLANGGKIPIANTFAFLFATRALEMVRTHLCYGGANVKLAGAYAGLSDSFDGPTHQTVSDLAIMRSLPRMTVVVPADSLAVKNFQLAHAYTRLGEKEKAKAALAEFQKYHAEEYSERQEVLKQAQKAVQGQ